MGLAMRHMNRAKPKCCDNKSWSIMIEILGDRKNAWGLPWDVSFAAPGTTSPENRVSYAIGCTGGPCTHTLVYTSWLLHFLLVIPHWPSI